MSGTDVDRKTDGDVANRVLARKDRNAACRILEDGNAARRQRFIQSIFNAVMQTQDDFVFLIEKGFPAVHGLSTDPFEGDVLPVDELDLFGLAGRGDCDGLLLRHVLHEKPAQVSLRGFSLDGPHVEGLAARTDSSRSLAGSSIRCRDRLDAKWQNSPERGLDAPFI